MYNIQMTNLMQYYLGVSEHEWKWWIKHDLTPPMAILDGKTDNNLRISKDLGSTLFSDKPKWIQMARG